MLFKVIFQSMSEPYLAKFESTYLIYIFAKSNYLIYNNSLLILWHYILFYNTFTKILLLMQLNISTSTPQETQRQYCSYTGMYITEKV